MSDNRQAAPARSLVTSKKETVVMPYTPISGTVAVPAQNATVKLRYQSYPLCRQQAPSSWPCVDMSASGKGWVEADLNRLALADGDYDYLLEVRRGSENKLIPDPFSSEIARFSGYRGVFHIVSGVRAQPTFDWSGELGRPLPQNNEIVIYELPVRWVDAGNEPNRQVSLGTFDKATFEHLNDWVDLGINAIELLPIEDSPDTLNWGYGTRFFFCPDLDMGSPVDLKVLVKACHQKGIRVLMDVVMNHSRECPLEVLAPDWYYLRDDEEPNRQGWGGRRFRFADKPEPKCTAHEFLSYMAEYWCKEHHIDGWRIDEFKGIDNWDFIRQFRDRAWGARLAERPFLVVAEDSGRDVRIVFDRPESSDKTKVVDAMWNFNFHDDIRDLIRNRLWTTMGAPSRTDRVKGLLSGCELRKSDGQVFRAGYTDLAQMVNYATSHDVQSSPRLMSWVLSDLISELGANCDNRGRTQALFGEDLDTLEALYDKAIDVAFSAWALTLTAVGIPMVLAGEEFLDVHDIDCNDWRQKMSDPVDYMRQYHVRRAAFRRRARDLVHLRTSNAAAQRNEIAYLHFSSGFDANDGDRTFAYCRTGGAPLGTSGQVVVIANLWNKPTTLKLAGWPWTGNVVEQGARVGASPATLAPSVCVDLRPFETRVFLT
jgi:pullulanase/glycogen debranching enzyme